MPYFAQYLLKLSISLAVVYLFYVLVLRRLTFHNLNRWYLLGYSLLSFFIPFVNISPFLERGAWTENTVVQLIPVMGGTAMEGAPGKIDAWTVFLFFLVMGIAIMLVRLLIQYISFLRIRKTAQLISDDAVKIYQVDQYIIPFSFGRSIFINQHQHKEEELKEIIRHEFIHVKQRHTVDILFGEILSMLNWYNPFTWLIRHAIRQNLEFIADHQVLKTGLDRKQYQYMLLKVVGSPAFTIASQFNVSSLKKRIAMMNKMRSAKVHLIKFLFVLPLITVSLLAFRNAAIDRQATAMPASVMAETPVTIVDTGGVVIVAGQAVQDKNGTHFSGRVDLQYIAKDTVPAPVKVRGYYISAVSDTSRKPVTGPDASLNGPANPNVWRLKGVGQNAPLIVLDGITQDYDDYLGSLNKIDPADIESITILKDRSAEAIYGEHGKYGVILVATKKGPKAAAVPLILDTVAARPRIQLKENVNLNLQSFPGLIVIDDKEYDSLSIRTVDLRAEAIESMDIINGKMAEERYGAKGARGVIVIKKKKDIRITELRRAGFPVESRRYTVGQPLTLQQDASQKHILYVGVDNRLPIDMTGVKPGELSVTLTGNNAGHSVTINYKEGIAVIKPTQPGQAELIVAQKKFNGPETILHRQQYEIKFLPPPVVVGSYRIGTSAPDGTKPINLQIRPTVQKTEFQ